MKRLALAAPTLSLALALALMGGSTLVAQPVVPAPMGAAGSSAVGSQNPAPDVAPANTGVASGLSTMGANAPPTEANMSPSMPMSRTMVGDQMTGNPAPSTYPVCTRRGQDRCRVRGGHMVSRHMKSMTTTETAPG